MADAIQIISSADPGSRANNSFIICDTQAQGLNICNQQDAITAKLVIDLKATDTVQWIVEALPGSGCDENGEHCPGDDLPGESNGGSGDGNKPYAYGKTQNWKIGSAEANTTVAGIDTQKKGHFKSAWKSPVKKFSEAKFFSFVPDMSDAENEQAIYKVSHLPAAYNEGSCASQYAYCLRGTNLLDVWRHNPRVGDKISVSINGHTPIEAEARMDEIDVIRQEYINHRVTATRFTNAPKIVKLPPRESLVDKSTLGRIMRGDWSQSEYRYLLNKHLTLLAGIAKTFIGNEAEQNITAINNIEVNLPSGSSVTGVMKINSGWRNPERNERVHGASDSRHMVGRALDIGFSGVPGYGAESSNRSRSLWVMWNALQKAPRATGSGNVYVRYFLENAGNGKLYLQTGTTVGNTPTSIEMVDRFGPNAKGPADGIPDAFNLATHFHVETKPDPDVGE